MSLGSLFSGIGLLDLGLERAGLGSPAWQVEIDPFCRSVLAHHWPGSEIHDDVRTFRPTRPVRLICGGFPCQPHSLAGKRLGASDPRHLWPEYARIVEEGRPAIVVAENVPGLRTTELRGVLADLAGLGFNVEWCTFSAGSVGAPHRRSRIWIVATHPERVTVREQPGWLSRSIWAAQAAQSRHDREILDPDAMRPRSEGDISQGEAPRRIGSSLDRGEMAANADGGRRVEHAISVAAQRGWARHCGWHLGEPAPVDDGSPPRLARRTRTNQGAKKKALGNAVVVRCAELVGRALSQALVEENT